MLRAGGYTIIIGALIVIAGGGSYLSVADFGEDRPGDIYESVRMQQRWSRAVIKVGFLLMVAGTLISAVGFVIDAI